MAWAGLGGIAPEAKTSSSTGHNDHSMNDQSASRSSCRTRIIKSLAYGVGRDAITSLDVIEEAVRKADEKIHGNLTDTETDPD